MRICPQCRTTYPSPTADVCFRDGTALVDHGIFVEAENDPLRGTLIGGRYRIVERVGQGGMGTVYRAEQSGLNRPVAVKILKQELNVDPDTVARFHREAAAMSRLTHANTVRVYDFGQTEDGLLYLVMELLEGELLTERMGQDEPMPLSDSITNTQQILRSLSEAHSQGIVHRDLKPDNIFLARVEGHGAPSVKVLDFGIAKVTAPDAEVDQFETQAGTVFGTPRYMSPEQAQGAPLDPRSDLYSVGTLLYQMVTGRPPFMDDDAVVVMAKHIRETPAAPSEAAPERIIPSRLEAVIMTSLEKNPKRRFPDGAAFEAALDDCIDDVLRASGLPPRKPRVTALRKALPFVLLTLALLAGGAYTFFGPRRSAGSVTAVVERPVDLVEAPVAQVAEEVVDVPVRVEFDSLPSGAEVRRQGEAIGTTPMELWVEAGTAFIRIELRKEGFQPLTAELTRSEGARMFELVEADVVEPPPPPKTVKRRPRRNRRRSKARPRSSTPAKTTPKPKPAAPAPPKGPYERFE